MKLRKPKRRIYELRPGTDGWYLVLRGGDKAGELVGYTKKQAESEARFIARSNAPSQLLIYTQKGRIQKGGNGEASYSADSSRRSG